MALLSFSRRAGDIPVRRMGWRVEPELLTEVWQMDFPDGIAQFQQAGG